MVCQQPMDFLVRLVANGVDLFAESFAGNRRIVVKKLLNFLMVFQQQRFDFLLLCGCELEVLCQVIEFLVDSARPVPSGILRKRRIVSSENTEHEYATKCKRNKFASHSPKILRFV